MAETTGIQAHTLRYVVLNTVKYTHQTNWSFNINGEMIDITSFDSSGWKQITSGTKSWGWSCTLMYASDAAENGDEAFADIVAGTTVTFLSTTGTTGDITFTGSCKITSWEMTGGLGEPVKITVSAEGTGALSTGTVGA